MKREPARHRLLRELSIAIGIAKTGRAPMRIQKPIREALIKLCASDWEGRRK